MVYLTTLAFTSFAIYLFTMDIYWGHTGDKLPHPYWNIAINLFIASMLTWVLISWIG